MRLSYPQKRMLDKSKAADYCNIPLAKFIATCPVKPTQLHASLKLSYDVRDLDKWIDSMKDAEFEPMGAMSPDQIANML